MYEQHSAFVDFSMNFPVSQSAFLCCYWWPFMCAVKGILETIQIHKINFELQTVQVASQLTGADTTGALLYNPRSDHGQTKKGSGGDKRE